jgi:hypothetical protein
MIKIKLSDVVNALEPVDRPDLSPIGALSAKDMGAKTAFKISKIIKALKNEYDIYSPLRQSLIKKYGKENKDGRFDIAKEDTLAYFKEHSELVAQEVELNIQQISIAEIEDIIFTPQHMLYVGFLIEDEEPECELVEEEKPVKPKG